VERVLIVGTGNLATKLCDALESEMSFSYQAVPVSGEQPVQDAVVDVDRLEEIVRRDGISRIVVAEQDAQTRSRVASALIDLRLRGLKVSDAADFMSNCSARSGSRFSIRNGLCIPADFTFQK